MCCECRGVPPAENYGQKKLGNKPKLRELRKLQTLIPVLLKVQKQIKQPRKQLRTVAGEGHSGICQLQVVWKNKVSKV